MTTGNTFSNAILMKQQKQRELSPGRIALRILIVIGPTENVVGKLSFIKKNRSLNIMFAAAIKQF